jgi:hypothetical protein
VVDSGVRNGRGYIVVQGTNGVTRAANAIIEKATNGKPLTKEQRITKALEADPPLYDAYFAAS